MSIQQHHELAALVHQSVEARQKVTSIDRPIFILGTQRSGTTLLCSMFDRHPDVLAINEFWDGYDHLSGKKQDRDVFIAALTRRFRLAPNELSGLENALPFELYRDSIASLLQREKKSRFLLKDPALTYHLSCFDREFPDARFIYLVRDPRATCLSQLSRHWNVANAYHGALLWRDNQETLIAFERSHRDRVVGITFEALLSDPEGQLRKLCEFVDIGFDPAMLTFYEESGNRRIHVGNENTTKPLQSSVADKWRSQLTTRQVEVIESVCRDLMREYGYMPESCGKRLNWISRRMLDLHQWFWTTYWWQRRTDWSGLRGLPRPMQGMIRHGLTRVGLSGPWPEE